MSSTVSQPKLISSPDLAIPKPLRKDGVFDRWTYSEVQREQILEGEYARLVRGSLHTPLFSLMFAGIGLIPAAGILLAGAGLTITVAVVAASAALGAGIGGIADALVRRRVRRLESTTPEAYFGPRGFYFCGRFERWFSMSNRLLETRIVDKLSPKFVIVLGVDDGEAVHIEEVVIPVPRRKISAAVELRSYLNSLTA